MHRFEQTVTVQRRNTATAATAASKVASVDFDIAPLHGALRLAFRLSSATAT